MRRPIVMACPRSHRTDGTARTSPRHGDASDAPQRRMGSLGHRTASTRAVGRRRARGRRARLREPASVVRRRRVVHPDRPRAHRRARATRDSSSRTTSTGRPSPSSRSARSTPSSVSTRTCPYIALVIVVHLATVVLLWHVMVRSRIDAWVALCFVTVFAVLGTGFENLDERVAGHARRAARARAGRDPGGARIGSVRRAGRDRGGVHDDRDDVLGRRAPDAPRGRAHRVRATRMAGGGRRPRWYRRPRTPSGTSRTAATVPQSPKPRPERCPGSSGTGSPTRSATWRGSR